MHSLLNQVDGSTDGSAWSPLDFYSYRQFYPATREIGALVRADASGEFIRAWKDVGASRLTFCGHREAIGTSLVLVRGLFGRWIPKHFAATRKAFARAGLRSIVANSRAADTVDANAALIGRDIEARVHPEHKLVFLCHSKGGLDTLAMLLRFPALRRRTGAVVLCQTPRAACAVLESVLLDRHRDSIGRKGRDVKEAMARQAIFLSGARPGCLELTRDRISQRIAGIDATPFDLPVISIASWSIEPTAWLDSQHARLGQIRPGCAHDGLFYLEDLLWPVAEQILLPRLDHSQPTVGGAGFDDGRFWIALAAMALDRIK